MGERSRRGGMRGIEVMRAVEVKRREVERTMKEKRGDERRGLGLGTEGEERIERGEDD